MRAFLTIALMSLLAVGCRRKDRIPSQILSRPQMQAIVWDLVRADEYLKDYVFILDSSIDRRSESIKLYQDVFRIHHTDKVKFQESFSWYRAHPDFLKMVLDSIDVKAQARPPEIQKPPMLKDTLHNLRRPLPAQQN